MAQSNADVHTVNKSQQHLYCIIFILQRAFEFNCFDIYHKKTDRHPDKKSRYIDVFCVSRQHLIYSITPDSGPSQLSVILSVSSTMSSNARLWNIRIYQVNKNRDGLFRLFYLFVHGLLTTNFVFFGRSEKFEFVCFI